MGYRWTKGLQKRFLEEVYEIAAKKIEYCYF